MAKPVAREHLVASVFYCATVLVTMVWWAWLLVEPGARHHFFGRPASLDLFDVFFVPDALSAGLLAGALAIVVVKWPLFAGPLAWIHFGAQGYATVIAVSLAVADPMAYWGVVSMVFSAGCALAFAIRLQKIDILWGPFKFAGAPVASPLIHWRHALLQTAAMWIVFLALVPLAIASLELRFNWHQNWLRPSWLMPAGLLLFACGGLLGLWAGHTMTHRGDGTPLPSAGARRLVVDGPYRFVRNPMALGGILQGFAVGTAIGSPLVMTYAVIGGVWWDVLARWKEEEFLAGRFGEAYLQYRSKVRCWIPRLRPAN